MTTGVAPNEVSQSFVPSIPSTVEVSTCDFRETAVGVFVKVMMDTSLARWTFGTNHRFVRLRNC